MTWVQSSETGVTRREKEELKKKISPTTIREERMDVNRSKLIGRVASAVVAAIVYIYNRRTRRASHWGSASKNNSSNCFSIRWSAVTTALTGIRRDRAMVPRNMEDADPCKGRPPG